jgi:hypothetical protein
MTPLNAYNRKQLPDYAVELANKQGARVPYPVYGILDGKAKARIGADEQWIYFDHSYFQRGWHRGHLRCVRNGLHLTKLLKRPDDRMKKFGVEIEPWRKTGTEIVIIPPSKAQIDVLGCGDWLVNVESRLSEITDRPVICKYSKEPSLRDYLNDCWAVVTFASVAGIEAAFMGIPVFSTDQCPSWPMNAGTLEDIERPVYVDNRAEVAASLAYASWHWDEMPKIKWDDYNYELL